MILFIQNEFIWKIFLVTSLNGRVCMNHIMVEQLPKLVSTFANLLFSHPLNKAEMEITINGTKTMSLESPFMLLTAQLPANAINAIRSHIHLALIYTLAFESIFVLAQ